MAIPDYLQWVRDKQRVVVHDAAGAAVEVGRGVVAAYLPASLVVALDDGGQAGYPVGQVSPALTSDPTDPTTAALIAAGAATTPAQANQVEAALKAAGFKVVRKGGSGGGK